MIIKTRKQENKTKIPSPKKNTKKNRIPETTKTQENLPSRDLGD